MPGIGRYVKFTEPGRARVSEVMAVLAGPPEVIELEPLGGVGYLTGASRSTQVSLDDVRDTAAK